MTNDTLTYEQAMKFQLRNCGFTVEYKEYKKDDNLVLEIYISDKTGKLIFSGNFFSPESFEDCYRVSMEYVIQMLLLKITTGDFTKNHNQ